MSRKIRHKTITIYIDSGVNPTREELLYLMQNKKNYKRLKTCIDHVYPWIICKHLYLRSMRRNLCLFWICDLKLSYLTGVFLLFSIFTEILFHLSRDWKINVKRDHPKQELFLMVQFNLSFILFLRLSNTLYSFFLRFTHTDQKKGLLQVIRKI